MLKPGWLQRRTIKVAGQVDRYNAYQGGEPFLTPRLRTALLGWAEGRTAADEAEAALLELAGELRDAQL